MNVFEASKTNLIGIGGTNHSGKDSAGNYLAERYQFMHISMSDVLRAEAREHNLDTQRQTLIEIGVRLREEHGQGAVVLKGIEQWQQARERFIGGLVLSSIRVPSEGEEVKRQGGMIVFIDAPVEVRYHRAIQQHRLRGDETFSSLEEYIEQEKAELEGLGGENRPHIRAIEAMSDIRIANSSSLDNFYRKLDEIMEGQF